MDRIFIMPNAKDRYYRIGGYGWAMAHAVNGAAVTRPSHRREGINFIRKLGKHWWAYVEGARRIKYRPNGADVWATDWRLA